jgi:hypothetical protein
MKKMQLYFTSFKRNNQKTVINSPEFAVIQEHFFFSASGPTGIRGGEVLHPSDGTSLPFLHRFS